MSGFYNSDKLKNIQKKEESETLLREKIKRKHFGDEANPGSSGVYSGANSIYSSNQLDQEMTDECEEGEEEPAGKAEIKIRSR